MPPQRRSPRPAAARTRASRVVVLDTASIRDSPHSYEADRTRRRGHGARSVVRRRRPARQSTPCLERSLAVPSSPYFAYLSEIWLGARALPPCTTFESDPMATGIPRRRAKLDRSGTALNRPGSGRGLLRRAAAATAASRGHTPSMMLYTCYGTFKSRKPGGHPCRNAYQALTAAGYKPQVVRTGGCVINPAFPGRRHVHRLTGNYQVPTLALDDGRVIDGTQAIIAWASANPRSDRTSTRAASRLR